MGTWEHLFLTGEFRARVDLLAGLNLEQVTLRPAGASHSIYDELWHAATWQRTVVEREPAASGDYYPSAAPEHEQQWQEVVRLFLEGARAAVAWSESPDRLALEVEPGVTMADVRTPLRRRAKPLRRPGAAVRALRTPERRTGGAVREVRSPLP